MSRGKYVQEGDTYKVYLNGQVAEFELEEMHHHKVFEEMDELVRLNPRDVMARVRDAFPGAILGGSLARKAFTYDRNKAEPDSVKRLVDQDRKSDMDFYLHAEMCTYVLKDMLKNVLFKDIPITVTTRDRPGYYKMPHIRKILRVVPLIGGMPELDIVVVGRHQVPHIGNWYLDNVASTLSEVYLELDFSDRGYSTKHTPYFLNVMLEDYPVKVKSSRKDCTKTYLNKIIVLCNQSQRDLLLI